MAPIMADVTIASSRRTVRHSFRLRGGGLGLALLLSCLLLPPSAPACVVGTGMGASCVQSALNACLPGGGSFDGTVTFNCGGAATITVTSTKTISTDTTIDGGSLITISGGNSVSVFSVNTGVTFTVQNLTIANGNSTSYGGGIANNGTLTVTNSTFSGNSASGLGGGIANGGINDDGSIMSGGTVMVTNSTFTGNSASVSPGGGGAIGNLFGTLTVTNSIFSGNSVASGGGGISGNVGTVTIIDSTFSGNSAGKSGGGISSDATDGATTLTVTNSTFFGNSGGKNGGGGIAIHGGALTVTTNSTFSGNSASSGGGIYNDTEGTLIVTNTIIANSTSGGNCSGAVTDGGRNIDDGTTCGFTGTGCATTTGTSFCNTNPVLDPTGLQNNGGPTQTIALQATSAAVDAGDETVCSMTTGAAPVNNLDQRGFVRPGAGHTHCSIGAYEFNSPGPPCVGDCGGNEQVTVDELLIMINIALGNPGTCSAGDANHDGQITVDEIITAINNALGGC